MTRRDRRRGTGSRTPCGLSGHAATSRAALTCDRTARTTEREGRPSSCLRTRCVRAAADSLCSARPCSTENASTCRNRWSRSSRMQERAGAATTLRMGTVQDAVTTTAARLRLAFMALGTSDVHSGTASGLGYAHSQPPSGSAEVRVRRVVSVSAVRPDAHDSTPNDVISAHRFATRSGFSARVGGLS